ncbi:P-loop containing nucleoside triphosphate hydrolase protein [Rhodocollybia butyracea]|uniref:P-loop containing nucleoside triphosphate hydrolase protein n=1 Tax=Rhodocollybia butyracea TaxID=206335 RepID=A0A9P5PLR2_9AGAR|nr:P-loop containing nucleoside triphosphate hydrolase protein [Rhodocollybia butyracea]
MSQPCWISQEGTDTLNHVVSAWIPQWELGLWDFQREWIPLVLDHQNLVAFTATGDGKSFLFLVPILIHLELSTNPLQYTKFPVQHQAVVMVITPMKGLATSILSEAKEFGIAGLSYCHEIISQYRIDKINLEALICECKTWNLLCIDPEHLAAPEWRRIINHPTFRANLIEFVVDEGHLIRSWGTSGFRPKFEFIGAFMKGCLPSSVPIVVTTATCAPGTETCTLCSSLGMSGVPYNLRRRSNERVNMQISIQPVKTKKGISKYALVLEILRSGRKTIIHVTTIPEAYAIYEYLWDHIPEHYNCLRHIQMYHSVCPDDYNQQTFDLIDTDPYLQVVIGTPAIRQGINRRSILDSIFFRFPALLDDFVQGAGRAGQGLDLRCRAVALLPVKTLKVARETLDGLLSLRFSNNSSTQSSLGVNKSTQTAKKSTKSTKKIPEIMDEAVASFLTEELCLTANLNQHYGNPPEETSHLDCRGAGHAVYCALCAAHYMKTYVFAPPNSAPKLEWLPTKVAPPKPSKWKSKTWLGKQERASMQMWLLDFRTLIWREFEPFNPKLSNHPVTFFFPDALISGILDRFLVITTQSELESLLLSHEWDYALTKSEFLWRLLSGFRKSLQEEQGEEVCTRRKQQSKVRATTSESESDRSRSSSASPSPMPLPILDIMNLLPSPRKQTMRAPRAPREAQTSMNSALADMGPVRMKRVCS